MPPQRPNFILPSHVPNVELDIFIRDRLDVEADSGDSGDVGVELELVEDRYGTDTLFAVSLGFCDNTGDSIVERYSGAKGMKKTHLLVFPAASRPSMSRRISRDPKILPMIFETEPPIVCGSDLP